MKVFKAYGAINWASLKSQFNQQSKILDLIEILALTRMSQYSKDRLSRLKKLVENETPSHETAYDSDDDMYHH